MGKKYINGSVKIGDTEMYYASFGSGKRKLVVLPGLSDGLATVKGKAFMLSGPYKNYLRDYTVYMFSRKNKMPKGYSIKDMADDQVFAMKELGIDKADLCGVSQGGMIAQCIAIFHPEIINKLVLAVTAPYANETAGSVVSGWLDMVKEDEYVKLMTDTAEKTYTKKYLDKYGKMYKFFISFTKPKSYDRFIRNAEAILRFDVKEELNKISSPTLIIAGDEDITVGNKAAHELKDGIQGSELYVYQSLGHGLFDEASDFYDRIFKYII
jgi:pimeloyl-ACP methyl ester carboxylesterase